MSKLDNSRYQPPMPHRYRLPPLVQPNWRPGDLIHFSPQAPEELADQLCKRYGVKHCLLLDRARSGLYLLCKAFGMNGEWIISPLMHRPTTVLLKQSCAGIALADVDEHFCIDPASVENMVGPSSCAILATHLYGKSADMLALRKVADRHGLLLIENAVHMAGGFNIGGKNISSWADATLLSFNVDKPLGAILGGALLTNRDDIWNAVRGKVRETNSIKVPLERIYRAYAAYRLKPLIAYSPLGRRFRSLKDGVLEIESFPTNQYGHYIPKKPHLLQAVIALQCSRREPEVIRRRRENADKLSSLLRSLQGIRLPEDEEQRPHSFTYYPVVLENANRFEIARLLAQQGIETKWRYHPIHLQEDFKPLRHDTLPTAERLWANHLLLPAGPYTSSDQIDFLYDALSSSLTANAELPD